MPNGLAFNSQELSSLASRSFIYDREGVLIITNKLKQDGFFKKPEVTQESWCRLLDNLLFYSKTSEQWSEIKGVVVLEKCTVRSIPQDEQGHWPFHLVWSDDMRPTHWLQLAAYTECDRIGWLEAIQLASHEYLKAHALKLQSRLEKIMPRNSNIDIHQWRIQKGIVLDLNEVPLCELLLSCDNLLCDSFEDLPNCCLDVHVKINNTVWIKYASTEVIERNRNPKFVRTIAFRKSDGLDGETLVRITVKDVRERISDTSIAVGSATVLLSTIQVTQRFRIALKNNDRRTVGFLTLNGWNFESSNDEDLSEPNEVTPWRVYCHRRSQSLPITLNIKIKLPSHGEIAEHLFNNVYHSTYRLHSELKCEITVHELMAESKLSYIIPQDLLGIWIQHEKEMLQEVLCIGEMDLPWKTNQMELLKEHYKLYNYYNNALENINRMRFLNKSSFKQSCRKDDPVAEFVPVNLHIQRMWAHDYNLNKSGFYDLITVGAFTAHCQKTAEAGLFQMVQQFKNSCGSNAFTDQVQIANGAVQAIKQLRGEVVQTMSELLVLAKAKKSEGMMPLAERMHENTRALLSLWDSGLVEEGLRFIDTHKVSSLFIEDNENSESAKMMLMLKRMNLQLNLSDIMSPDLEDFATPSSPTEDHLQFLDTEAMSSSASANYYQPSDEPEPWDLTQLNVEASVMCLVSKVKFLCGHCFSPAIRLRNQNIRPSRPRTIVQHIDPNAECNAKNIKNNHSSNGDVKSDENALKINTDYEKPANQETKKVNRFADGLNLADVSDWAFELRPSMRKLRQAMDGLLKGGRLVHAVLRLRQNQTVLNQIAMLQVRRDVCFSQALTSLVTGLVCWLWSTQHDIILVLLKFGLGPLCYFEGLLTLHGNETPMWGDMIIAVEDLQTVTFQLIRWNQREQLLPQVKGSRTSLIVTLPVHPDLFSKLSNRHTTFSITPVFFNIGINAKADAAESSGNTMLQHKSNLDNFDRLNEYHLRYQKLNFPTKTAFDTVSSKLIPVEEMMVKLKGLLMSKKVRNVELLQEVSSITKALNGIHMLSCKSGKDRTSMACTLEQCYVLLRDYNLTREEFTRALGSMRSEGCRRENTMKNIGVRKYAFTKTEVMALPHDYRPPLGTYGSTQT